METSRYSETQIFRILKEVGLGISLVDAVQKHGTPTNYSPLEKQVWGSMRDISIPFLD